MVGTIKRNLVILALFIGFVTLMMSCNRETPVNSTSNVSKKMPVDNPPNFCIHVKTCANQEPVAGAYVQISYQGNLVCEGYTNAKGEICLYIPDSFVIVSGYYNAYASYGGAEGNTEFYYGDSTPDPVSVDVCIE